MKARHIPNAITLSRLCLAPPLLIALYLIEAKTAMIAVFVFFALTDWIDGALARGVRGWSSAFGQRIDPYADKALCWPALLGLILELPTNVMILVPIAVFLFYDGMGETLRLLKLTTAPNWYAKKKTLVQMVALLILWCGIVLPSLQLFGITFVTLGLSLLWISTGLACIAGYAYLKESGVIDWILRRMPIFPSL